jgi:hypothetical protein
MSTTKKIKYHFTIAEKETYFSFFEQETKFECSFGVAIMSSASSGPILRDFYSARLKRAAKLLVKITGRKEKEKAVVGKL